MTRKLATANNCEMKGLGGAFRRGGDAASQKLTIIHAAYVDKPITVLDDAKAPHKLRFAGIGRPDRGQAFGERSKQSLSA